MGYNVFDDGSIRSFLLQCCDGDAALTELLVTCLERPLRKGPDGLVPLRSLPVDAPTWLVEQLKAGVGVHRFRPDARLADRVGRVACWIMTAMAHDEAWLRDVDAQGRPRKLLKIGSLAQAEAEADKAMRRFAFNAAAAPYVDGEGEATVQTFANGYRIVQLLTPAALDRESAAMGSCAGGGGYDRGVETQYKLIYSLRDAKGLSHVTLEVDPAENSLVQCLGKQNVAPVARYLPMVRSFVRQWQLQVTAAAARCGFVQDALTHELHSLSALPRGLHVGKGGLWLHDTKIDALPEDLRVDGNLYLGGSAIKRLPRGLIVSGGIDLRRSAVRELPAHLSAEWLSLEGTAIAALPRGLRIGGAADLRGTEITALPDDLQVGGDLNLWGTDVAALPEGLRVGGRLVLACTKVMKLPSGLSARSLDLRGTQIRELPDDLKVLGGIRLPNGEEGGTVEMARAALAAPATSGARPGLLRPRVG
ncbi:hypothetical protein [Arvimicrobium flavum]|uniref:hypothetical protein n=1 Tax=Arvimicrobium flavum TaxID=3393320 RepID=UPI00237A64DE|nr:hypothetical protein [Mesorhizobium shangrilense]